MGIGESAQVWEQMDMDAVTGDFERLFPSFSFDAQGVLADIMSGQLLEALKKLGDGLSGAVVFQREEFRTLFLRFWFWVWRRRFYQFCGHVQRPSGIGAGFLFRIPSYDSGFD